MIGQQPAIWKERLDIARGICPFSDAPRKTGLPEAIIGDARNDDHPLLSQLVVLFHYVHNTIVCRVAADPAHPLAGSPFDMDHLNYLCARSATTLIYRSIIRHDLLGIDRCTPMSGGGLRSPAELCETKRWDWATAGVRPSS